MSSKGYTISNKGILLKKDAFVVIVKTSWNKPIIDKLEKGAKKILKQHQVKVITIEVPGAVEIPFAVKQHYAFSKKTPDAYIMLGAVIKGGTPHFDYVCKIIAESTVQLNLQLSVPVIFGVLTLNNETEAFERLGGVHGHKGEEAALTAIQMVELNNKLQQQ
ncbi:MAG: 6,7-dimethyl-8-ribityllumazine synthase [Chitinophagaceae bacterium]